MSPVLCALDTTTRPFTSQQGACPRPLKTAPSLYTMTGIKPSIHFDCGQFSRERKQAQDHIKPSRQWGAPWTLQATRQIAQCQLSPLPQAVPARQEPPGFSLFEGHNFVLKGQKHSDSGRIYVKGKEDFQAGTDWKRLAQDWQIAHGGTPELWIHHSWRWVHMHQKDSCDIQLWLPMNWDVNTRDTLIPITC